MAGHYITTNQIGNSWCPQIRFEVWTIREDDKYVYYDWYIYYDAHGYAAYTNGRARSISAMVGNGPAYDRSININGITGTKLVAQGSDYVWKQKQQRWVPMTVSFGIDVTWNGSYAGTTYANGGFYIDPITSYSVKYDANGGTGAPGNQLKWYDENITISSTAPTRKGYSFQGWATTNTGSVAYKPGATYSANSSVTLYAIWKADTYPITYDANGGSGAPAAQTKTYGQTLKLSDVVPVRENYNFLGWGTSASSTTVAYSPGADYTGNTTLSLYAIWELAYVPPKIENINIVRCRNDGAEDDFGTNIKFEFKWTCDQTIGLNEVTEIKLGYKKEVDSEHIEIIVPATGITGTVSEIVGNDEISIENAYDTYISVRDSRDGTLDGRTIPSAKFVMDFKMGGDGISFGEPASTPGFHVNMNSYFKEAVHANDLMFGRGSTVYVEGSPDGGAPQLMPFMTTNPQGEVTFQTHALAYRSWLQARLKSGETKNLLRLNANDQVEVDWTEGGVAGKCLRLIWSGELGMHGTIEVPELPYYRFFMIQPTNTNCVAFGFRDWYNGGTIITAVGGQSWGNRDIGLWGFRFEEVTKTSLKMIGGTWIDVKAPDNSVSNSSNELIKGIYGVL